MLILALDTSGDTCSVALMAEGKIRTEYRFAHARHLTERLPEIVSFVLKDGGVALRDIEAFAVGLGPGSFTGVRVGVTMAKVWALSLEKPVVGISSLDALAREAAGVAGHENGVLLAAVAPTRRGEVVAAYYTAQGVRLSEPTVTPHETVGESARVQAGASDTTVLVIGETAEAVLRDIPEAQRGGIHPVTLAPSAAVVARLAAIRLERGEVDDTDALVPLYVTPTPVGGR